MPKFAPATLLRTLPLALAFTAAVACVSFPGVTGSGDGGGGASSSSSSSTTGSTGGGGSGAGSSTVTGAGAGSSVSSSSGGGGCVDDIGSACLEEAQAPDGDQATLSNEGQTLVMEAISGDAWWEDTEGDFFFTEVTGSFAARVRVSVTTSQELGFEVGGLLLRDSTPEWVKFEAGRITPAAGISANVATAGLLLGRTDEEYHSEHLGAATGEPYVLLSGPVWLGVCHVPTVGFAFFYRTTGSWTLHEQAPINDSAGQAGVPTGPFDSFGDSVQVGLIAGDFLDDSDPDTIATFEGFQIGPLAAGTLAGCEEALEALSGPPHCGFCLD